MMSRGLVAVTILLCFIMAVNFALGIWTIIRTKNLQDYPLSIAHVIWTTVITVFYASVIMTILETP